ncbi:hypothetical protein BDQ12DRAFT_128324 [Crucibulum laeve]|uniref:Uncharacterized protein n=1 Tax=Crucibulum laeve TaxID=68775 RepID=A0A5C3M1U9_9AGAR|nr:hypothetical protein BDQ12DRAFT_128324 [Crucibulum laeve]
MRTFCFPPCLYRCRLAFGGLPAGLAIPLAAYENTMIFTPHVGRFCILQSTKSHFILKSQIPNISPLALHS